MKQLRLKGRWISTDVGNCLNALGAPPKKAQYSGPGGGAGEMGVLCVRVKNVSSGPPHRHHPEEDLCGRPCWSPLNGGAWDRDAETHQQGQPIQHCHSFKASMHWLCTKSGGERATFPHEACQVRPL